VVVHNFEVDGPGDLSGHAPLVVDANAVLTFAIHEQSFKCCQFRALFRASHYCSLSELIGQREINHAGRPVGVYLTEKD
jgi:hypothetical protein